MRQLPPALPADEAIRLTKICALFGSDKSGERAAAAAAAHRIMQQRGLEWSDVFRPPEPQPVSEPSQEQTYHPRNYDLHLIQRHLHECTDWEQNFVRSVSQQRNLSLKQRGVLSDIAHALRTRGYS